MGYFSDVRIVTIKEGYEELRHKQQDLHNLKEPWTYSGPGENVEDIDNQEGGKSEELLQPVPLHRFDDDFARDWIEEN